MAANRIYFLGDYVVVGSNPTRTETFCSSVVERIFNPVISPYYVPTAIAAYFFSLYDSGKIRRLLVIIIAEDGDMREIYKDYLLKLPTPKRCVEP